CRWAPTGVPALRAPAPVVGHETGGLAARTASRRCAGRQTIGNRRTATITVRVNRFPRTTAVAGPASTDADSEDASNTGPRAKRAEAARVAAAGRRLRSTPGLPPRPQAEPRVIPPGSDPRSARAGVPTLVLLPDRTSPRWRHGPAQEAANRD